MRTKILACCAVLGVAWAVSCSTSNDGTNGDGGNGGDSGGKAGSGSAGKGGAGSGGKGGAGSGGSSSGGSASGGSSSGGSGGESSGGSGGGGAGGMAFVAKHPTWGFEEAADIAGWVNGIDHFGDNKAMGQCDHGRYAANAPMISDVQKKDGAKSLAFDIDLTVAKPAYDALMCKTCTAAAGADAGSDAMTCTPKAAGGVNLIATNGALSAGLQTRAGAMKMGTGALLPVGTIITMQVWFPGTKATSASITPYLLGVGVDWTAGTPAFPVTDGWNELTITLPAARTVGPFWSELGILIGGLPATFKGTVYIDSVDIKFP